MSDPRAGSRNARVTPSSAITCPVSYCRRGPGLSCWDERKVELRAHHPQRIAEEAATKKAAAEIVAAAAARIGPERCAEAAALIAPYLLPGFLKALRERRQRATDLRRLP